MIDVNGHASAILGITQQGCVEKLFAIRPFEIYFFFLEKGILSSAEKESILIIILLRHVVKHSPNIF